MNARNTLFAMFALVNFAALGFTQDWTSEATYTKTVTTTTVTTYTPNYEATGYAQPWNNGLQSAPAPQPTVVETNYLQPAYAPPAPDYGAPINLQPALAQPAFASAAYAPANYVQPATLPVAYAPAAYAPAAYARAAYAPVNYAPAAYVRPVEYAQPRFVARPVFANYYPPVYRPVVAAYAPNYMAAPATCEVPVAQPVMPVAPAGPKVWVHEKVYVQGQPLRNLLTAITP